MGIISNIKAMYNIFILKAALKQIKAWDEQSGGFESTISDINYMLENGVWFD